MKTTQAKCLEDKRILYRNFIKIKRICLQKNLKTPSRNERENKNAKGENVF